MIDRALLRWPDDEADVTVLRWESLATELSVIIGKRGFESLYARSLLRARVQYPWLPTHPPQAADVAFKLLALNLKTRERAEAHAASTAIFCIFTDILISLIGNLLTNSILSKAWGDEVLNDAGTEHRP
jgi:hypothetical protein